AHTLPDLESRPDPVALPLADAVRLAFPVREIDTAQALELSFGRQLPPAGIAGVHGALAPDGSVVALLRETDGAARPVLVFAAQG
ncbi:MAG TPA: tRNA pseudouridine(55) synthase TruB, partial [Jatrophihabitans sp.]|nr:tRNA pseudouridine(55) synthase TruB [Jatrophihabitans sp.]